VANKKVKLFADDTNLFVFENSSSALNQKSNFCINELNKWIIANKLSLNLNLTKTRYMVLSYKPCDSFELCCGQHVIEKVDNCRYLEIVIDSDLEWKLCIEHVYHNLVKFTSIFFKLRQKLMDRVLKLIYFVFVHSYILYGVQ
jgi:hypothetical protein